MTVRGACWLALLSVWGCAGRDPDANGMVADSAGAPGRAAAPAAVETEEPPVDLLSPGIRRACASVTEYWRGYPGAVTRQFDSTLTRPRSTAMADGCWIVIRLEDDPVRPAEFRVPFVAAGWLPMYEFDADGPDGRSRVYQLDPVHCLVQERWDGGNPGDTTYVQVPWFEQHVACYRRW